MKNEQDREQLQRYFGQGNNSDPLKNSNRPKRSEDLSFDQTQWFVSEDGQDKDDFEQEEPQPQEDFLPNGGKKKNADSPCLSRFAQKFCADLRLCGSSNLFSLLCTDQCQ